ncbi:hypothetical protein MJ561_13925 [Klebsiella pneumoniae]|nr:hypothetical protein MJ561_13925 [Klebsiella pneumoniae]
MPSRGLDRVMDPIAVGRACIAYPDWASRIVAGEELELFIDSTQREALHIPNRYGVSLRCHDPRHEHGRRQI